MDRYVSLSVWYCFYTLNKYMTHRFLFHLKPPKNVFLLKMLRRLHYDHHVYPDDLKLLFLPVWFSVPSFTIYLLISYGITKSVTVTLSFGIGMIIMLLVYEWKHYIAHKPIRPVTRFGRWLKNSIYYTIIKTKSFGLVFQIQYSILYLERLKMEKTLN